MNLKESINVIRQFAIPQKRAKMRILYLLFINHHTALKKMGVEKFVDAVTIRYEGARRE